jgi:TRAP-type uncharacterized transport system fused permease subunit
MDFAQAGLLALLVFVLVEFVKRLVPAVKDNSTATVITVILAGQATVWLVGTTVWAHEQVIGNHTLDTLNSGSKIVAGIILAAMAVGINVGLDAIRNIGQNQKDSDAS